MNSPFFSIILPTFNRAHTLPRALQSVAQQTFKDFELWVIDDGSTDKTTELVQKFRTEFPKLNMHILHGPNRGVSHARNLGIQNSSAPWLAFLDSDDEWLPEKLKLQAEFINKNPESLVVHGEEIWIRNEVRVNPMKKHKKSGGKIFIPSLELCLMSPSTIAIKRSVLNDIGGFREDFQVCEDYDLWLRITAQHSVDFIDKPLIKKYGGHEDQLSRKFKAMDYWRVRAMDSIFSSSHLDSEQRQAVAQTLLKKCEILIKGYQKHQNLTHLNEILSLRAKYLHATSCPLYPI